MIVPARCLLVALVACCLPLAASAAKPRVFVLTDIENEPDDAQSTWSGISGDNFWGRFGGADFSLVDNPWLDEHVRGKGPLGAQHPKTAYLLEGDTPSFLFLIQNGLGTPERPDWGGWGGRYEFYTPPPHRRLLEPETRPFCYYEAGTFTAANPAKTIPPRPSPHLHP